MKQMIVVCLLAMGFASFIAAQETSITFDGEVFSKVFIASPPNGNKLIEFVRESEDFENWTKLISFRYQQMPNIENSPKQAGITLYKRAKANYPGSKVGMMLNQSETDAIVHFLAWPKDGSRYIESNIFRYVKSKDKKAVISLQVAFRIPLDAMKDPSEAKKLMQTKASILKEASNFDMNTVHKKIED